MHVCRVRSLLSRPVAGALALAVVAGSLAAQMGPMRVGYTAARRTSMRPVAELPGTVEARTAGLVASEVAGLVVEKVAREGDRVGRGQPLVRLRRDTLELDLRAAEAELAEATARRELARRSHERSQELFEAGVISRQQLDDATSEFEAWQGRTEQLAAHIARLRDQLDRSVIRAPFSGVVVREHCEVGEWVAVGDPVAELADLSRLEVLVQVPEHQFAGIERGAAVAVTFEALPGLEIEGTITSVVPWADPQARTFPVKVTIPNPDGRVGVGMLARVSIPVGAARPATVVPKDAVVGDAGRRVVYVLEEQRGAGGPPAGTNGAEGGPPPQTARAVPVETGGAMGVWIEVEGIEPGQKVVTRGNERLFPGATLLPEPVEYPEP